MYDLLIEGGALVDGTGAPRASGDIAISDGRIVAMGKCDGAAKEKIDANGAVVTPGFVDLHTHYGRTDKVGTKSSRPLRSMGSLRLRWGAAASALRRCARPTASA